MSSCIFLIAFPVLAELRQTVYEMLNYKT